METIANPSNPSSPIPDPELLLLTHVFGDPPSHFVDDVVNAVNEVSSRCLVEYERIVDSWVTERDVESEDDDESERIKDDAISAMQTLLDGRIDSMFDLFEIFVSKQLLRIPSEVLDKVTLPEFESVDNTLDQQFLTSTSANISELKKEIEEKRRWRRHLIQRQQEYGAMLPALRTSVQSVRRLSMASGSPPVDSDLEGKGFLLDKAASSVSKVVPQLHEIAETTLQRTTVIGLEDPQGFTPAADVGANLIAQIFSPSVSFDVNTDCKSALAIAKTEDLMIM
ncbi:Mis12 protein-domain-containing protein [Cladochytrium replicatum]|nr:Mis12 protein-domain-containing protein [Cladochytrium replicatum]